MLMGVILFGSEVYADTTLGYITQAIQRDQYACDENNGVCAFAYPQDALCKVLKFCSVGFTSEFLVPGVHH
jgi:hypothetical protein